MKDSPFATIALINSIYSAISETRPIIDGMRSDNRGESLPHLEMGALTDWFIAASRRAKGRGADRESAQLALTTFLDLLEQNFQCGEREIDNLIGASFLENLQGAEGLSEIRRRLPAKLATFYSRFIARDPGTARPN